MSGLVDLGCLGCDVDDGGDLRGCGAAGWGRTRSIDLTREDEEQGGENHGAAYPGGGRAAHPAG